MSSFCVECGGCGMVHVENMHGGWVVETCRRCNGSQYELWKKVRDNENLRRTKFGHHVQTRTRAEIVAAAERFADEWIERNGDILASIGKKGGSDGESE